MAKCCSIQPGIPLKTANAVPGKSGGKALNSYQAFSSIIKGIVKKSSKIAHQFDQTKEPIKAKHLIGELKKNIMARSINSKKVILDDHALVSLEKLLIDAGFEKTAVSELIDTIKNKNCENGMTRRAFLTALDRMDKLKNEDDQLSDISALPYLESIFKMFGMDNGTIEQVLSDSTLEGIGIDITRLISALGNKGYTDKFVLQQSGNEQKIADMMDQIKITDEGHADGKITLEAFVLKLKNMVAKKQGIHVTDATLTKEAKTFINQLRFDEDTDKGKEFFDKINKIKSFDPVAKILSSEGQKTFSATESFSKKPEVGVDLSSISKEMETLLKVSGKMNATDLSEKKILQETGQKTIIKTIETNSSSSKNGAHLSMWNQDSFGTSRLSSGSTEKMPGSKLLPSYVLNQVSRQIVKSVENGNTEIRLQLKPPHLGRLQITIETVNDNLKVNIVAEHHATRDMLIANSAELKTVLFDQGIRLEKVDVQLAFNFDQSMSNAKHDFRKSKGNKNNRFSISGEIPGMDTMPGQTNLSGPRIRERLLDLVA